MLEEMLDIEGANAPFAEDDMYNLPDDVRVSLASSAHLYDQAKQKINKSRFS